MANAKMLVDTEDYLVNGVHVGTRFSNAYSKEYIQKSREDGLKLIDIGKIDSKMRVLVNLLSSFKPEEIAIVGRRDNAKKGVNLLGKIIGCDVFTKRYLPGKLTNVELDTFKEYKLMLFTDSSFDKSIVLEAFKEGVFTASFVDTNDTPNKLDLIVPLNNKGKKSIGFALYVIAKTYAIENKILSEKDFKYEPADFTAE